MTHATLNDGGISSEVWDTRELNRQNLVDEVKKPAAEAKKAEGAS